MLQSGKKMKHLEQSDRKRRNISHQVNEDTPVKKIKIDKLLLVVGLFLHCIDLTVPDPQDTTYVRRGYKQLPDIRSPEK